MIKSRIDVRYIDVRIGMIFSKLGLSPNQWTVLSIVPAVAGFLCLYAHDLIPGLIFFVISGLIDAVDGAVARVTGSETNLGAYLDGIIDRYVEILLLIGLLVYGFPEFIIPSSIWIALLIFGSVMTSYARSYADHRGVVTEKEDLKEMGGLLERFERLMLIYTGMVMGYFNILHLTYMVALVAVLANFTALQRIFYVLRYRRKIRRN